MLAELKKEHEEEEKLRVKMGKVDGVYGVEFRDKVREVGKEINERIEEQHQRYRKFMQEEKVLLAK